jgi:hypothetical protein
MEAVITTITGFQNFPNLEIMELDASSNGVDSVDVSGLTNLTYIDVSDMDIPDTDTPSLKYLNVSGCTSLEEITMDDSDFSEGFPSLAGLNSLQYFDADQCDISGSIDLSNLSALQGFDLGGNESLTEVILSSTQSSLGTEPVNRHIDLGSCALTESSVNQILIALYDTENSGGKINISGGTNAAPTGAGATALYGLVERSWNVTYNRNSNNLGFGSGTLGEVCTIDPELYGAYFISAGATGLEGNSLYTDDLLIFPALAGWYSDGSIRVQVTGSTGLMGAPVACA